jgi:hypothetical protein
MYKSVLKRKAGSAICALVHTKIGDDQLLSTPGQGHFGMAARRRNAPNEIGRPFNNLLRRLRHFIEISWNDDAEHLKIVIAEDA